MHIAVGVLLAEALTDLAQHLHAPGSELQDV